MAAPAGNLNSQKSGIKSNLDFRMSRHGIQLSRLPAGCAFIHRRASQLRTALERLVIEQRDEVTVGELATIGTAATWAIHGMLCARWLEKAGESLTHAERLGYSREVARASTERERAIGRLGLEKPRDRDPWSVLDETPAEVAPEASCKPVGDK